MATSSVKGTLGVAAAVCVFCSILVSTAAVKLKPFQIENKTMDIKRNLLLSAGLIKNANASKEQILKAFSKIETVVIDLSTGKVLKDVDAKKVDSKKESKDPIFGQTIPADKDLAGIKVRSKRSKVFFAKENGSISMLILPIHGKGLWSTMYGFLAIATDTVTVKGFGFYEHGETPGLGGEIDNPRWKKLWKGKKLFDENYRPAIRVIKGIVDNSRKNSKYMVDGLAGATLTARGVEGTVRYWLSDHGYGPFLKNFRMKGGM